MLTEDNVISQISVDEHGNVSVRLSTRIYRDEVMVSETYHRTVLAPGSSLKEQPTEVVAIAKIAHTKDRIAKAKALTSKTFPPEAISKPDETA